jgi:4-hydroxythreonine-4-phosphate dehydrogenase
MSAASPTSDARAPAIVILADDLSGAADCGVACTELGLQTVVALRPGLATSGADALAIDANTRAMTATKAAEVTEHLAFSYRDHGLVFKKLDSTLRGHLGPELGAMLRARRAVQPEAVIIVAPAFPTHGRTTVDGHQRLHGVPLERTEIWRREYSGETASIPMMLRARGLRTSLLPLHQVRADIETLSATLHKLADGCDVIVCDAETEFDLAAVAASSLRLGSRALCAGSAGLARQLVEAAHLSRPRAAPATPVINGSMLFVIGSRSSVSRRQAAVLAVREGVANVASDPTATREELLISGAAARLGAALAAGQDTIIWQPETRAMDDAETRDCGGVAALLAAERDRIGALFATGGETARCLLEALDVEALDLVGEIEPGVPMGIARGTRRFPVITKAGAFGTDLTLVTCRSLLRGYTSLQAEPAPGSGRMSM